jgi:hypothetical protein
VIGAFALSVHGYARFSDDLDLLTMDHQVLRPSFWDGIDSAEIRRGDESDPLAGVVRIGSDPPIDVIVGRGHAMAYAVRTAAAAEGLSRVASPTAMLLLKLEAGGLKDRQDIVGFVRAQRALNGALWLSEVDAHLPNLSDWARRTWARVEPELRGT